MVWILACPSGGGLSCPRCIENVKGRASHRGHACYRAPRTIRSAFMARFVRPATADLAANGVGAEVDPSDFMAHYPSLLEFLSLRQWEDGGPRETGTLTLFQGPDGLQAALNDKDSGLVAFQTASSFTGLLRGLEEGLSDGSLQWRLSRDRRSSRKR